MTDLHELGENRDTWQTSPVKTVPYVSPLYFLSTLATASEEKKVTLADLERTVGHWDPAKCSWQLCHHAAL